MSRLDGDDLELAVTTAYLGGRVAEAMAALQRAERFYASAGDHRRAARRFSPRRAWACWAPCRARMASVTRPPR